MKIKAVCEATGLTDRTIRFYIEEGLVSPAFTENYLGRKTFDFSQEDVRTLQDIAVLRKFDFTIDEIYRIIEDASLSGAVIADVKRRIADSVAQGEEKLCVLSKVSDERTYTLSELAEALEGQPMNIPEKAEQIHRHWSKVALSFIKDLLIFTIVWSPVALSLFVFLLDIRSNLYPVFNYTIIGLTLVSFWPSFGAVLVSKVKWKWKKIVKPILLVLCVLSIPVSSIMSLGIVSGSETNAITHYRLLDVDCLANRSDFFQELFPKWANYQDLQKQPDGSWKTVSLDAHYYYCKRPALDYTYDIYAQWPLEKREFDQEVARVKVLYENEAKKGYSLKFEILQKGRYTCLFAYSGDAPFEEVTNGYTYYIFAYDETKRVVRYIMCDSLENGVDQPYYLSLDW